MSSKKSARERLRAERAQQAEAARRKGNLLRVGIGVAAVLIVVVGFGLVQWQRSQIDTTASFPGGVAAGAESESNGSENGPEPGMGDGIGEGSADAPVVVELFEDFSCPHCADFERQAPDALEPYLEKNQIRVVYYPMTLDSFRRSGYGNEDAANAFACAADEEDDAAAVEYHRALFANPRHQQDWNQTVLLDLAAESGLDSETFDACVKDDSFGEWVRSIDQTATDRGVSATPTVLVNGTQVEYQTMGELVDRMRVGIDKALDRG